MRRNGEIRTLRGLVGTEGLSAVVETFSDGLVVVAQICECANNHSAAHSARVGCDYVSRSCRLFTF